jgi:hypothetical protein
LSIYLFIISYLKKFHQNHNANNRIKTTGIAQIIHQKYAGICIEPSICSFNWPKRLLNTVPIMFLVTKVALLVACINSMNKSRNIYTTYIYYFFREKFFAVFLTLLI